MVHSTLSVLASVARHTLPVALAVTAGCARSSAPAPVAPAPDDAATEQEERVNIGYGSQRRQDVTGSVASASAEQMRGGHSVSRVEEMIEGRFPGVDVVRLANGGFSLRVRGARSLMSNNEPLVVVDGMALSGTRGSILDSLSPGDISRIDVLKDAAATSIYGSRGANGVILITTKR